MRTKLLTLKEGWYYLKLANENVCGLVVEGKLLGFKVAGRW